MAFTTRAERAPHGGTVTEERKEYELKMMAGGTTASWINPELGARGNAHGQKERMYPVRSKGQLAGWGVRETARGSLSTQSTLVLEDGTIIHTIKSGETKGGNKGREGRLREKEGGRKG